MSDLPTPYYFDALPVHPAPEASETFTSYLLRLASLNGLSSIPGVATLLLPNFAVQTVRALSDFPLPSYGNLPIAALCAEDRLNQTTFYYLGIKLGRSTEPQALSRFLEGTLSSALRYCPRCLAEGLYYRLTWRFVAVKACLRHRCLLLSRCGHCRQPLPLFPIDLKIGVCPSCEGQLQVCQAPAIADEESNELAQVLSDLEFLLSPQPADMRRRPGVGIESPLLRTVGQQFADARIERRLLRKKLAQDLRINERRLAAIERGELHLGATFKDYLEYATLLGMSLQGAFKRAMATKTGVTRDSHSVSASDTSELASQGGRRDEVRSHNSSEPVTRPGRPEPCLTAQFRARQDELLAKTNAAIEKLRNSGQPTTYRAITEIVGLTRNGLKYFPEVRKRLLEVRTVKRYDEDELVLELQAAIAFNEAEGIKITQNVLCNATGISLSTFRAYSRTKKLLDELASKYEYLNNRRKTLFDQFAQEKKLLQQVQQAIRELEEAGRTVTQIALSEMVGMSPAGLKKYSGVKVLFEQIVSRRQASTSVRESRAD
jgi:ribosome-binding protein aMBF1 (putative translation factor)